MRKSKKHTPRKKVRSRHMSVLEASSLVTQINTFSIRDCMLSPLTSHQSSTVFEHVSISNDHRERAAAIIIQKHWRAYKMRGILNQFVVQQRSQHQNFVSVSQTFKESRVSRKRKEAIVSTAEPFMASAVRHILSDNKQFQPIINSSCNRWLKLINTISKKRDSSSQRSKQMLKEIAIKALENINNKDNSYQALKRLEIRELYQFANTKVKLQEISADPLMYDATKAINKQRKAITRLARRLQKITKTTLSSDRFDLLKQNNFRLQIPKPKAQPQQHQQLHQRKQPTEGQQQQDSSDYITIISEDTPRLPYDRIEDWPHLSDDVYQWLIEQLVAEIYLSEMLETVTPFLKVIKIPFTKLSNKDVQGLLSSLKDLYRKHSDLYMLEQRVQQIIAPFIKIEVPPAEQILYPLATVSLQRMNLRIIRRQEIIGVRRDQLLQFLRDLQRMYLQTTIDALIQQVQTRTIRAGVRQGTSSSTKIFDSSVKAIEDFLKMQRLFTDIKEQGQAVALSDYFEEQPQFVHPRETIEFVLQTVGEQIFHELLAQILLKNE